MRVGYHLAIGEERDLRHGVNHMRHVNITSAAVAHVALQHGLKLIVLLILAHEVELVLQIIDAVLFLVSGDSSAPCKWFGQRSRSADDQQSSRSGRHARRPRRLTLEALEAGLALGADLVPLPPLVLVACAADWEGAFVAGHEQLPVHSETHVIPANLADLAAQLLQRPRLQERNNANATEVFFFCFVFFPFLDCFFLKN